MHELEANRFRRIPVGSAHVAGPGLAPSSLQIPNGLCVAETTNVERGHVKILREEEKRGEGVVVLELIA